MDVAKARGVGAVKPPWRAYPNLHRRSVGWREGEGADYYDRFCQMFLSLPAAEQNAYEEKYPEPHEWRGFYGVIRHNPVQG
jgi:hypothetical protein